MNTKDMTAAQLSRMYQTKQLRSKIEISYRTIKWMAQAHFDLYLYLTEVLRDCE